MTKLSTIVSCNLLLGASILLSLTPMTAEAYKTRSHGACALTRHSYFTQPFSTRHYIGKSSTKASNAFSKAKKQLKKQPWAVAGCITIGVTKKDRYKSAEKTYYVTTYMRRMKDDRHASGNCAAGKRVYIGIWPMCKTDKGYHVSET